MEEEISLIKYPAGFGLKDIVAWGNSGLVVLDVASQTVIKTPWDDDREHILSRERQVYERLTQRGGHDRILQYHGAVENGIRLEFAPNCDIRTFLRDDMQSPIDFKQRLRWATQAASALEFVHRAGIIHGDLTCHNIFLDEHLEVKLGDVAGSSVDGSGLLVGVTASHEYPGNVLSTQGDIFAFGSVVYEMMTGAPPYADFSAAEIEARYKSNNFADTTSLGKIGVVIKQCWSGGYNGFKAIVEDLKGTAYDPHSPINVPSTSQTT